MTTPKITLTVDYPKILEDLDTWRGNAMAIGFPDDSLIHRTPSGFAVTCDLYDLEMTE